MERNDSLHLINSLSTRLHGSLETAGILAITLEALRGLTPRPQVTVCLQDSAELPLNIVAGEGEIVPMPAGEATPLAQALHRLALENRRLFVRPDFATDPTLPADTRAQLAAAGVRAGVVFPCSTAMRRSAASACCMPTAGSSATSSSIRSRRSATSSRWPWPAPATSMDSTTWPTTTA